MIGLRAVLTGATLPWPSVGLLDHEARVPAGGARRPLLVGSDRQRPHRPPEHLHPRRRERVGQDEDGEARTIRLPSSVEDALERHRAMQAEENLAARPWEDPRLAFPSRRG